MSTKIKRIFLITVDCLRADHVGCIGGGKLTPHIDKLAREATVFTRAYANGPGTNQSFPAILSSTYFLMHGSVSFCQAFTTLAEVLSKNGYRTIAFHSNPFLSAKLGWNKGFHEFYDFMDIVKSPSARIAQASKFARKLISLSSTIFGSRRIVSYLKWIHYKRHKLELPYVKGEQLNSHVINWINRNATKYDKLFLWVHYMDPHGPYVPPEKYLKNFETQEEAFDFYIKMEINFHKGFIPNKKELESLRYLYSGEVRYADECIGKLIQRLEDADMLEDFLVVITGDHGEAFLEHSQLFHSYKILYNEVIHVPLVFLSDHPMFNRKKYSFPVQLLDIPPTICKFAKITKPSSFCGSYLLGEVQSSPIFSESAQPNLVELSYDLSKKVISCIYGKYKLIVNEILNRIELFDLSRDPREKNNLADTKVDLKETMETMILNHLKKVSLKRSLTLTKKKISSLQERT